MSIQDPLGDMLTRIRNAQERGKSKVSCPASKLRFRVLDVLKQEGPRRVTLVMMRDITSDEFGQAFMTGLNNNIDKTEKTKDAKGTATPKRDRKPKQASIFARLMRFIREVRAELRKVIWPTRKELVTYTAVVIVFVSVMTALVAGLDIAFAKVVVWVFG